jgi:hypothetical protein
MHAIHLHTCIYMQYMHMHIHAIHAHAYIHAHTSTYKHAYGLGHIHAHICHIDLPAYTCNTCTYQLIHTIFVYYVLVQGGLVPPLDPQEASGKITGSDSHQQNTIPHALQYEVPDGTAADSRPNSGTGNGYCAMGGRSPERSLWIVQWARVSDSRRRPAGELKTWSAVAWQLRQGSRNKFHGMYRIRYRVSYTIQYRMRYCIVYIVYDIICIYDVVYDLQHHIVYNIVYNVAYDIVLCI